MTVPKTTTSSTPHIIGITSFNTEMTMDILTPTITSTEVTGTTTTNAAIDKMEGILSTATPLAAAATATQTSTTNATTTSCNDAINDEDEPMTSVLPHNNSNNSLPTREENIGHSNDIIDLSNDSLMEPSKSLTTVPSQPPVINIKSKLSSSSSSSSSSLLVVEPKWKQFQRQDHSLRIPASEVAALTGYHPFRSLPKVLLEHIYQGHEGHELLVHDSNLLNISLQTEEDQLLQLAKQAGSKTSNKVQMAVNVKKGITKLHSVEETSQLQQQIVTEATKSQKLTKLQLKQLRDGTKHSMYTGFGTMWETSALNVYERQCGWDVYNRNGEIRSWPFAKKETTNNDDNDHRQEQQQQQPTVTPMAKATTARWKRNTSNNNSSSGSSEQLLLNDNNKKPTTSFKRPKLEENSSSSSSIEGGGGGGGVMVDLTLPPVNPTTTTTMTATHTNEPNNNNTHHQDHLSPVELEKPDEFRTSRQTTTPPPIVPSSSVVTEPFPFFSIRGSVDGIIDELIQNNHSERRSQPIPIPSSLSVPSTTTGTGTCTDTTTPLPPSSTNNEFGGDDDDDDDNNSWILQRVIVECKHRMTRIQPSPPLYEQIQAIVYCFMYEAESADIVQVLRKQARKVVGRQSKKKKNDHNDDGERTMNRRPTGPVSLKRGSAGDNNLTTNATITRQNDSDDDSKRPMVRIPKIAFDGTNNDSSKGVEATTTTSITFKDSTKTDTGGQSSSQPRNASPRKGTASSNNNPLTDYFPQKKKLEPQLKNPKESSCIDDTSSNDALTDPDDGPKMTNSSRIQTGDKIIFDCHKNSPTTEGDGEIMDKTISLLANTSSIGGHDETGKAKLLFDSKKSPSCHMQNVSEQELSPDDATTTTSTTSSSALPEPNKGGNEEDSKKNCRSTAAVMPPPQPPRQTPQLEIAVHRVYLDDPILQHRHNWQEVILPRLRSWVDAVYTIRNDDTKRYRFLEAMCRTDLKGITDAWELLFEECAWLKGCDTAFLRDTSEESF